MLSGPDNASDGYRLNKKDHLVQYRGDVTGGSSTCRKLPSQSDSDPFLPCDATAPECSTCRRGP